jgi:hypothetical protein
MLVRCIFGVKRDCPWNDEASLRVEGVKEAKECFEILKIVSITMHSLGFLNHPLRAIDKFPFRPK